VEDLQSSGYVVGMIGDGINDSPALAQADVGFTLNSGTDIALEVAEIVLMRDSLLDVAVAIHLSHTIVQRIYLNFMWACLYNVIGIPVAAGFFAYQNIWISPQMAGLAMALSSISVIGSSLMLKRYKAPVRSFPLQTQRGSKYGSSFFQRFFGRLFSRRSRHRHAAASVSGSPDASYIPLTESQFV
jgi:Cu+-exporting ATPase